MFTAAIKPGICGTTPTIHYEITKIIDTGLVPINALAVAHIEVIDVDLPFCHQVIVGDHETGHGRQEDAVTREDREEHGSCVDEPPGVDDGAEESHQVRAATDVDVPGEDGRQVDAARECVARQVAAHLRSNTVEGKSKGLSPNGSAGFSGKTRIVVLVENARGDTSNCRHDARDQQPSNAIRSTGRGKRCAAADGVAEAIGPHCREGPYQEHHEEDEGD
ncbi:hypothetical protein HG531_009491 [Fusarium graminearum]|nr:hypothetical protein HG531_009491 [Fusarium graminearum]